MYSDNGFNDEDIQILADGLQVPELPMPSCLNRKKANRLETLDLSDNNIGEQGGLALLNALSESLSLRRKPHVYASSLCQGLTLMESSLQTHIQAPPPLSLIS